MSRPTWEERRLHAKWWTLAILAGVTFGLLQFLATVLLEPEDASDVAWSVVPSAVVFGLVMGVIAARYNSRVRAARGTAPPGREDEVQRAVTRGPVPEDDAVRAAARCVLEVRLGQLQRMRIWGTVVWVLFIALALWLSATESPWWLLGAVLFAAFLGQQLWLMRHLQHRRVLLSDPDQQSGLSGRR